MKHMRSIWFLILIAAAIMLPQPGRAEPLRPVLFASAEFNSSYLYYGTTYNDGPVFQPTVDVSVGNLGFYMWGNMDFGDYNGTLDTYEFSEVDLALYYTLSHEPWGTKGSITYAEYLYPHVTDSTTGKALAGSREFILKIEQPLFAVTGLGLKGDLHYDCDEFKSLYGRLGLKYAHDIVKDALSAEVLGLACYADNRLTPGLKTGMHHYDVSLGMTYKMNSAYSVGLKMGYIDSLNKDVLPEDAMDVHFYGGLNVNASL